MSGEADVGAGRSREGLSITDEVVRQVNKHDVADGAERLGFLREDHGLPVDARRWATCHLGNPDRATACSYRLGQGGELREDVRVSDPDRVAVAGRQEPRVHLVKVLLEDGRCRLTSFFRYGHQTLGVEDALGLSCAGAGDERHVLEVCDRFAKHPAE